MAPEDPYVPGSTTPSAADLAALVGHLAERVDALEQTVALLSGQTFAANPSEAPEPTPHLHQTAPPPPPIFAAIEETAPKASLEDRLGSQIFNRIGIVALLIGTTWFLKLAMDNHWIGPLGRVMVGLIAGAGLVLWSERFRRQAFAAFSYSLKAIGSGVLYLSLWAAFQLYHLVPSEVAFALMLLVTLWNAWMAWAQDSELLAAYAIAGGFATPLLLSTGGNHQVFLFSYLLTIDLATIALVRCKKTSSAQAVPNTWSLLLLGALPATIVFFIGWFSSFYTPNQLASTSLFIALFFLAFLSVPIRLGAQNSTTAEVENAPQAEPISDVLLPLLNAVFASFAFYFTLQDSGHHDALPWVSLLFAAIYLGIMRLPQTAAARAVHLSLAILFVTIAIPLKASGRWITIGWLAEGIALLWVSSRLSTSEPEETDTAVHRMLLSLSAFALTLGFLGLLVLPYWLDRSVHTAVFNQRFATELAGLLGLAAAAYIATRASTPEADSESLSKPFTSFPSWQQIAAVTIVAFNLIALQSGIFEIQTFWWPGYAYAPPGESALQTALSISAFLMLYGAALLAAGFWKHSAFLRWQALFLLGIATLKTFLYDVRSLSQGYRVVSFLGLGALLMAVSFAYVRRTANTPSSGNQQ